MSDYIFHYINNEKYIFLVVKSAKNKKSGNSREGSF